jgi:putative nucleotidyltransferase with HDIG domain
MSAVAASTPLLIRQLERLPANPTAAVRVLWLTDDPSSSSEDLAVAVNSDPMLTARIMQMANSAYYGLSGRVPSSAFAITVLGFSAVRTMAAAAAAGALEGRDAVPPGFWAHAAATAAAAALVADRVGASRTEAFSLGLLHDLGRGLLHRIDAERYADVTATVATGALPLIDAERESFGTDHVEAMRRVLEAWRFPSSFVEAIARHHDDPATATSPLGRALVAGEALAIAADPGDTGCGEHIDQGAAFAVGCIRAEDVDGLVAQVRRDADWLAASLAL